MKLPRRSRIEASTSLRPARGVEGGQAVIRLVTDDSVRVMDALRAQQYDVREGDVLVSEPSHKPGMLSPADRKAGPG